MRYDIPAGATQSKTLKEWAQFLHCNPETLRRAHARGELLATYRPLEPGHPLEVTPADMRAFLEKRRMRRTMQIIR